MRRGVYTGPLNLTWVAIGGGFDGPNPYTMMEFIRRVPDGASLTLEIIMRNVLPINMMAHRHGPARPLRQRGQPLGPGTREKMTSVEQVEQLVRIAGELGREVATGKEARDIYRIGEYYGSADETLAKLGFAPNRQPGQRGFTAPRLISRPDQPRSRRTCRCGPGPPRPAPAPPCRQRTPRSTSTPSVAVTRRHRTSTSTRRNGASSWHRWSPEQGRRHRRRPGPHHPTARELFPWVVFALTFGLLLSDYMSRQVLSAVFPFLKAEWALTDTQLGALTSVVALTVGLLAVPLSLLGDRWGRGQGDRR